MTYDDESPTSLGSLRYSFPSRNPSETRGYFEGNLRLFVILSCDFRFLRNSEYGMGGVYVGTLLLNSLIYIRYFF